jgi:hypothetical protein
MLTFFSTPKAFCGHFDVIQRNAIQSWLRLRPLCEIILLGEDAGTVDVAAEFGVRRVPDVARNELGTPLVNSLFQLAERLAKHSYLCYVNADIVLIGDFLTAVERVAARFSQFLLVGRRWDVDIRERLDFSNGWTRRLESLIGEKGKLHGHTGIDYFVFPRGLWADIPAFAIGRGAWDNWLIYEARRRNIPVVDVTQVVTAIHQNHDYSHFPGGEAGVWKGIESQHNMKLAGGLPHLYNLADADYQLTRRGVSRKITPYFFYRSLVSLSESHASAALLLRIVRGTVETIRA